MSRVRSHDRIVGPPADPIQGKAAAFIDRHYWWLVPVGLIGSWFGAALVSSWWA